MSKILLILGSGPRVGQATIQTFSAAGYKVISTSRSAKESTSDNLISTPLDLSDPTKIEPLFKRVQAKWGAPSVVVYNGEQSFLNSCSDVCR